MKKSWVLLIALHLVFFAVSIVVITLYQGLIIADTAKILAPLQEANFDATSLQDGGTFLTDIAPIYAGYQQLVKHIKWMLGLLYLTFVLLCLPTWLLMHHLYKPVKKKQALRYALRTVLGSVLLFVFWLYLLYELVQKMLNDQSYALAFLLVIPFFVFLYLVVIPPAQKLLPVKMQYKRVCLRLLAAIGLLLVGFVSILGAFYIEILPLMFASILTFTVASVYAQYLFVGGLYVRRH